MSSWLEGLVKNIHEDFGNRQGWVQAREHYLSRRYCQEWRNPTTPWVGSSNVVLPLIDKKIDELKPQYVNMIVAARPPVTCHAIEPQYQRKTRNVELWFDWLVHTGSPRFVDETILAVDDCLEMGRGIIKSYWRYETRTTPTHLTASRLPKELRPLIVAQGDEKQAGNLFVAAGGPGGAIVLTRREFDQRRDQVGLVIQRAFDLDPDEAKDKKAIGEVMAWFRAGAKGPLKFESRDIVINVPAIRAVSPLEFIVPENATNDIEEHERIVEVMRFTPQQLRTYATDNKLIKSNVDELLDKRKKGGENKGGGKSNWQKELIDLQQSSREGVSGAHNDDLIDVWKVSTRMSVTEGGPEKKVIALIPADTPDMPLKIKAHSRPSGMWGYHSFTFELNKRRWYAPRGIPEKIDDIEAEITAQHRAKLNRMAIVTAPTFKYRAGKGINPATMKFFPGQMWPTNDPNNDMIETKFSQLDPVFDNEVQFLRTFVESYLGGPDYGLTGNSTLTEARTAEEIRAVQGQARQSLAMRGLLLKLAYDEAFTEIFNLWHTIGPEEVYIRVTGGDEPIRLTKEDLQGKYILQCTGTIGSSDPTAEAQKAQARILLLAQIKQAGLMGLEYDINMGELIRDWMEKDDIRLMKRVLIERTPEQIQQAQQEMQKAQAQAQQQELAIAAAGGKSATNGAAKGGQRGGGGMPQLPALSGSRN